MATPNDSLDDIFSSFSRVTQPDIQSQPPVQPDIQPQQPGQPDIQPPVQPGQPDIQSQQPGQPDDPLADVFSSFSRVSEVQQQDSKPPEKTFTNLAGNISSGVKNIAEDTSNFFQRKSNIALEAIGKGSKVLFIDTPGVIIDLVSRPLLQAFGVPFEDLGNTPGVVEKAGEVTGIQEFFKNPKVKALLPHVNDKTDGEKFFSLVTEEVTVNVLGTLTGLKLIGLAKNSGRAKELLLGMTKVLDKKAPGILKGLFTTAKELAKSKVGQSAASGVASGFGIEIAQESESLKDSPYKDLIGSLAGSIGFESMLSIFKTARSLGNKVVKGIDPKQTIKESKDALAKEITDIEQAKKNIAESEQIQGVIDPVAGSEKFEPSLTQATADPGLIAKQNEVAKFNEPKNVFLEKTRTSNIALNNALESITPSKTALDTQRVISKKLDKFTNQINKEADRVTQSFEDQKSILSSALDVQAGGGKVRQRASRLIQLQRAAENKIYSSVRGDVTVDADEAMKGAQEIVQTLKSRNELFNLSPIIERIANLNGSGEASKLVDASGRAIKSVPSTKTTMETLVGFRKELTKAAREARAGKVDLAKAKWMDDAVEAIDKAFDKAVTNSSAAGPEVDKLRLANKLVRGGVIKFRTGAFKKILERTDEGVFKLPDSEILPILTSSKGQAEIIDQFQSNFAGSKRIQNIMQKHLQNTVIENSVSVKSLDAFIAKNKPLFTKNKQLRHDTNKLRGRLIKLEKQNQLQKFELDKVNKSTAKLFIGLDPDQALQKALKSGRQGEGARELVKAVEGSAEGLDGLRRSFIDLFKEQAKKGGLSNDDILNFASDKGKKFLNENREAFDVFYEKAPNAKRVFEAIAGGGRVLGRGGKVTVANEKKALSSEIVGTTKSILRSGRLITVSGALFATSAGIDIGQQIISKEIGFVQNVLTNTILADDKMAKALIDMSERLKRGVPPKTATDRFLRLGVKLGAFALRSGRRGSVVTNLQGDRERK